LTEVEAYLGEGEDPGSHAHRGRRVRNATMFGEPGHLYVYFTYGMHWCANLVCHPAGVAGAVLLRGAEVTLGLDLARSRRPSARSERDLARGPARLAQVLALDREADGLDACRDTLHLVGGRRVPTDRIRSGPRVGVAGEGAAAPWRWWLDGEASVSAYRPGKPRRRAVSESGTLG
jgi:DNA-3-methyladenine glycosylase